MRIYQQSHLMLEEAMTKALPQSIRVWSVPGIHIDIKNIPGNATQIKTSVMKAPSGNFTVFVEWSAEEGTTPNISPIYEGPGDLSNIIERFPSLEDLKTKFPQLFELEGSLFATQ